MNHILSSTTRARIDTLHQRMAAAGIKDVKFTKDPVKWNALTEDERAMQLCAILEAYLDGKCKPAPQYLRPIGPEPCRDCAGKGWNWIDVTTMVDWAPRCIDGMTCITCGGSGLQRWIMKPLPICKARRGGANCEPLNTLPGIPSRCAHCGNHLGDLYI